MDYKATIHTLEISVGAQGLEPGFLSRAREKDYVRVAKYAGTNEYSLVINPHKFSGKDANGKYKFNYHSLQQHTKIMESIAADLDFDDYSIKRLDLCFDTELDYEANEKLLRYITLMLAGEIGADNRYWSIDPLTQEIKTVRASKRIGYNGTTYNGELQIEHYDRSKVDQDNWDTFIMNRLELRSIGTEAGKHHAEGQIIERWRERLQAILRPDIAISVETEVNRGLYEAWERKFKSKLYSVDTRKLKGRFNGYLLNHFDSIFTRRQLVGLYCLFGEDVKAAAHSADNLRSQNKGILFNQLFRPSVAKEEIESLFSALDIFTGKNS